MGTQGFGARLIRAARLDHRLYADVEADTGATSQSLLVIGLVGLAHSIGAGVRSVALFDDEVFPAAAIAFVVEVVFWLGLSGTVQLLGRALSPRATGFAPILRSLAFASGPGMLVLLAMLVSLPGGEVAPRLVLAVVVLWRLAATFVAIRQALGIDIPRTVLATAGGVPGGMAAVAAIAQGLWIIL